MLRFFSRPFSNYSRPISRIVCNPQPQLPPNSTFDVIVVGAGHNGLVSASYLAKSGLKVAVLERRDIIGGAAITEEINPGFKYSRASYVFSLFRPQIVRDLELKKHGLKLFFRDPSSFTPTLDGKYLLMSGNDMKFTQQEIAKFSQKDADIFPKYEHYIEELVSIIEPYLDTAPPQLLSTASSWKEKRDMLLELLRTAKRASRMSSRLFDFYEMMTAPASKILDRWFESEPLKATLATDAIIGACLSPYSPGSAYVLFHHVMGGAEDENGQFRKGAWCYVQGGMGAVSQALASSAKSYGASIFTQAPVKRVLINEHNRATGVELEDGHVLHARHAVVSNAAPQTTFLKLVGSEKLPGEFARSIQALDSRSPVVKINLSLSRLPSFRCLPSNNNKPGPQHTGTIHLTETTQEIHQAYLEMEQGRVSSRPVVEWTIPSSLDNTLAPAGAHVSSLFCQYAPYKLDTPRTDIAGDDEIGLRTGWTDKARQDFANKVFDLIEQYVPDFKSSILHYEVLAPPDLEAIIGLPQGNIFHTAMSLDQLFFLRPAAHYSRYRTPIRGLYLGGAGAHPGGGVMGAPGRNASMAVLYDLKK